MRFYFDTEFIEDGRTIDLISIGIVADDNREYYACVSGYDADKANDFVKANVLPFVVDYPHRSREVVADEIKEFIGAKPGAGEPEFWAYFADYDWVALCQLYGPMSSLPICWPYYCRDLKQVIDEWGANKIPITKGQEHHALDDARWCRNAHSWLLAATASGFLEEHE
jgi:hypothetical protein